MPSKIDAAMVNRLDSLIAKPSLTMGRNTRDA